MKMEDCDFAFEAKKLLLPTLSSRTSIVIACVFVFDGWLKVAFSALFPECRNDGSIVGRANAGPAAAGVVGTIACDDIC